MLALFGGWGPRVFSIADTLRIGSDHDQGQCFLRVSRGKQTTHWSAFGNSAECSALRAHRIHHCPDVVHALLECRQLVNRHPIGKSCSTFVKKNQTCKRGEAQEETRESRFAPEV